jgi:hypothetical protein
MGKRVRQKQLNIYTQVLEMLFGDNTGLELTLFLYDGSKMEIKIFNN